MYEAHSKEGLRTLDVLAEVDESRECLVETEELVECGCMRLALAVQG